MKYLIALILLSLATQAADIWHIGNKQVLNSQNTLRFLEADRVTPKAGYVINPDRTAVRSPILDGNGNQTGRYTITTPRKYWKLDGQAIISMTQTEKDAVDAAKAAEAGTRATKAAKETKIAKGVRLAAIEALYLNGDITLAKRDTWKAKENE